VIFWALPIPMTRMASTSPLFIFAVLFASPVAAQTPPPCFDFPPLAFDEPSTPQPEPHPEANSPDQFPTCDGIEPLSTSPLKPVTFEPHCKPQGWVTISFRISESGDVLQARLSGMKVNEGNAGWALAFAERASESMRQWRYPKRDNVCEAEQEFRFETTEEGTMVTRSDLSQ